MTMSPEPPSTQRQRADPGRRAFLNLTAGALVVAMLEASLPAAALAESNAVKSDPRYKLVDCVADLVIPTTDTPGASAAGVTGFVLLALDRNLGGLEPGMWTSVQAALDAAAGGDFLSRPSDHQRRLLTAFDAASFAGDAATIGSPEAAWRGVKAAIVAGYYCSEAGATQELVFDPVPGAFHNVKLTSDYRNRSIDGFGGGL